MNTLNTSVLFLIFNRPEKTKLVFDAIRKARPSELFIAADGPRDWIERDLELCLETRNSVISSIDWPCKVHKLFRDKNLGCGRSVSESISWFFSNVDEGIILEDDCLPSQSFFSFCEEMLIKYRNNERVMHIGGNNFQKGKRRGSADYYFSRVNHVWGWATWKKSWQLYDFSLSDYSIESCRLVLNKVFKEKYVQNYYQNLLSSFHTGKCDTWDYQWTYCIWKNQGVCIIPQVNLISNIGFGEDATHTYDETDWVGKMQSEEIEVKIHPAEIRVNRAADYFTLKHASKVIKPSVWNTMKYILRTRGNIYIALREIVFLIFKRTTIFLKGKYN